MILENMKLIDASLEVAWAITQDVENWPEWTPTVDEVTRLDDGPFGAGSEALIKQPGLPPTVWRVTEFRDGEGFTWQTRVRGIHMSATHDLSAAADGTRSTLRLKIDGFLGRLLGPLIKKSATRSLEKENVGLKNRCEEA